MQVEPVACWLCIDGGETDWKVAVIDSLTSDLLVLDDAKSKIEKWLTAYKSEPLRILKYITDPDFIRHVMQYHITAHRSAGPSQLTTSCPQ